MPLLIVKAYAQFERLIFVFYFCFDLGFLVILTMDRFLFCQSDLPNSLQPLLFSSQ
jgi:hypothetical protein